MGKDLQRSDRNWDGSMNWDAMSHQQLWDWFSQPQLAGMQGSVEAWTGKVAGHFQAAADEVNQALRTAGVHWEGQAAQSMQDASTPLAEHALVAKDAATTAGHTTLRQFMTAHQTAATVPEPKQVPTQQELLEASGGELALMLKDSAEHEAAAREAEERARDLARSYDSGTDDDVAALPRFEPAPAATVDKAEPGSPDVIDSESFEPGNGDPGGSGRNADTGGPGATGGGPGGSATDASVTPRPGDPSGGSTSGQSWTPPAANQPAGPGTSGPVDTPRSTTPAPVTGLAPGGPGGGPGQTSGGPRGSAGGPGSGGRSGGPAPGTGGRPAPGPGSGVRGAVPGEGPVSGRAGGPATTGRGAGGMGMAPMGAGRGKGDEDTERTSPEYLRDHHDEFWDDTPAVAPPVIGEDDDE